jgi:hypothetical protein
MNCVCKLEPLILNFLELMIALRVAGRLRGSWEMSRIARVREGDTNV